MSRTLHAKKIYDSGDSFFPITISNALCWKIIGGGGEIETLKGRLGELTHVVCILIDCLQGILSEDQIISLVDSYSLEFKFKEEGDMKDE